LAQEHKLLVRANVDRPGRLTVGFDRALERLANCGIVFEQDDLRRLHSARNLRNDVVHFAVRATPEEMKAAYVDLFEFAHVFHLKEFGEELHNHVEEDARDAEAYFMEAFRTETTIYQGAEIRPPFAAEIVAAQYGTRIQVNGGLLNRIPYGDARDLHGRQTDGNCHDCAVRPGQFHVPDCDNEACPGCGRQLITCDCEWSFVDPEESTAATT
jgi:hypothetical protein